MQLPTDIGEYEVLPWMEFLDVYQNRSVNRRFFQRYLNMLPMNNHDLDVYQYAILNRDLGLLRDLLSSGGYRQLGASGIASLVESTDDIDIINEILSGKSMIDEWIGSVAGGWLVSLDESYFELWRDHVTIRDGVEIAIQLLNRNPERGAEFIDVWLENEPSIAVVQALLEDPDTTRLLLTTHRDDVIMRLNEIIRNSADSIDARYLESLLEFQLNTGSSRSPRLLQRYLRRGATPGLALRLAIRYPSLVDDMLEILDDTDPDALGNYLGGLLQEHPQELAASVSILKRLKGWSRVRREFKRRVDEIQPTLTDDSLRILTQVRQSTSRNPLTRLARSLRW